MLNPNEKIHRTCLISGERVEFDAFVSSKDKTFRQAEDSHGNYVFIGITRQIWTNDYKWDKETHDCFVFRLKKHK